jgi:DNA-binding GntR family transcriptional regulator
MAIDLERNGLPRLPISRSLDDMAYEAIKEAIISGSFAAGAPLVETRIAEQLGVSKTPVRAAFRRLEARGFLERVPHSGVYVTEYSFQDVKDVFAVRAVLEGLAMRIAAAACSQQEIDEARTLLEAAERSLNEGKADQARELGREWHSLLLSTVPNRFLSDMLELLKDHIERGRSMTAIDLDSARKSIKEHNRILDAIEARDGELAENLVRTHLVRVVEDFEDFSASSQAD